ncbi:MAG TPA: hypothetical protein VKA84_06950 [Gemmatimonadaceae bacterium]|nr:hypothetical protein [Gemmatimonadaceae bacterium]
MMARDGTNRTAARSSTVLVLSDDPMAAALLGILAELAHRVPAFAHPGERPEDALARVRPLFVVLLDGSLDAARSDLFFARAAKRQVGIAIFGVPGQAQELAARARERGIPWFDMPIDLAGFTRVLEAASATDWWRGGGERRRAAQLPRTTRSSDGTLIYLDRDGRRWFVYDRRGTDRRRGDRHAPVTDDGVAEPPSGLPPHRVFVNESGETWRYALGEGESALDPSAADLERQLAQATRV